MKKTISIFGSTGSIGGNVIEIIKNSEDYEVISLVADNNVRTLISQALLLKPKFVVINNDTNYKILREELSSLKNTEILCGQNAILEVAKIKCDLFIAAIVGAAGMLPVLNAIRAGSNIALANKECLVCGGEFILNEVKKYGVKLLPVDSEHNAIFQIFENENLQMIENITLTASGGPFFNKIDLDFSKISVKEALNHPRWKMGAKITIDSATMMNKGLEMIEAYHLFPVNKEQINVVIHPQSIIHGLVNYKDGSTLAMLSNPDMKVPISYALSYPSRMEIAHEKLNLAALQKLEFFECDEQKFPAVKLAKEAIVSDGNAPIILNAANEIAVAAFLEERIKFDEIVKIVEKTLQKIPHAKPDSIEEILNQDQLARKVASELIFSDTNNKILVGQL